MGRSRGTWALVAAMAVHALVLGVVQWRFDALQSAREAALDADGPLIAVAVFDGDGQVPDAVTQTESIVPIVVVPGPADVASEGAGHPLPNADVDLPGARAASRGGGAEGGSDTWTGRNDAEEWRAQSWNDPEHYRLSRHKTGTRRASDEALERRPDKTFDDRTNAVRRRARRGQAGAAPADAAGTEPSHAPALADEGPDAEVAARDPAPTRVTGAVDPTPRAAHVDQGAAATDASRRGAASDDTDAAGASNERNPGRFDMTRPRAGGDADGAGVAGPRPGDGVSARGVGLANASTAALRAAIDQAPGPAATRARRQNPYFRRMYAAMDRLIEFPEELALNFDQGEVIVRFTLFRDGRVGDVVVEKSSGFAKFDRQVTRAVGRAGPYGPVPESIIGNRAHIVVRAPYAFRNPLIR